MQQTLLVSSLPLAGDLTCLYEDTTGEILSVTGRNWSTRYILVVTVSPLNGAPQSFEVPPKATVDAPTVEVTHALPRRYAKQASVTTFDGMAVLVFEGQISVGVRTV